jgi:hypothetical protein
LELGINVKDKHWNMLITLEKSWREQEARVCDVNSRRMHEEERDALDILGEFALVRL